MSQQARKLRRETGGRLDYLNNNFNQGLTTRYGDVELAPGTYSIEILYWKNQGANLLFENISGPDTKGSAQDLMRSSMIRVPATYAKALKSVRADTVFALQSPRSDVRLLCLAAIAVVQSRPLVKAAMFSTGLDGDARVAMLRAFEHEPRLLATVDRIVLRNREKLPRAGV